MENQETSWRDYYYHLSSLLWDKRVKTVHVLGVLTRVKFGSTWWFDCVIADNKPYQNQWISATCSWSCENVAPCKRRDSIRWYSLKLASTNRIKGSLMYFHFCHEGAVTRYLLVDLWGFIPGLLVESQAEPSCLPNKPVTWLDLT